MNSLFLSRRNQLSRYRISEVNVAKILLKAAKFVKGSVHAQCILFKNVGDVFAADAVYHCNCLNKYFKKVLYDVDFLMAFEIQDYIRIGLKIHLNS